MYYYKFVILLCHSGGDQISNTTNAITCDCKNLCERGARFGNILQVHNMYSTLNKTDMYMVSSIELHLKPTMKSDNWRQLLRSGSFASESIRIAFLYYFIILYAKHTLFVHGMYCCVGIDLIRRGVTVRKMFISPVCLCHITKSGLSDRNSLYRPQNTTLSQREAGIVILTKASHCL